MKHPRKKALILCMAIMFAGLCAPGYAQTASDENEDTTGTLPTIFIPRVSVRYEYTKPANGNYITQTILRGDYTLQKRFLFRADLPYVATDLANTTESGLGDAMFRAMWLAITEKKFAVAAGASMIFDTASEKSLGTGQNVIVPLVAGAYSLSQRFWVLAVLQDAVSLSGTKGKEYIHTASFLPGFYFKGGRGGWLLLQPVVRTDIAAGGGVTFSTEFELGQKLSRQFALALRTGHILSGDKNEDYSLSGEIRYLFL